MKINSRFIFVLSVVFLVPFFTNAATLTLSPSSTSVNVNGTFTVSVLLNTTGAGAYGVDINRLRFNPSLLQVVDSDAGTAGVQIASGSLMSVTTTNTVDNTAGTIQFSQLANFGTTYNGSGTLATITFRGVSAGSANVTFDFTSGSGTDTNVAGLGSDLLTSVSNGTYTINVPDTTPPVISSVATSGITPNGATITWTTNENSDTQVDYGLTTSYGQSSTLNTTMLTSHSVSLTGLTPNTIYNYRVRSRDASGNLATGANQTFTTSSAPDTTAPSIPTGLTATPISTSQINLSWNASTDTAGSGQVSSGVAGYQVWRGGVFLATTTSASYSNTGLLASTNYSYQVASFDNAGNVSSRTTSVNATTQTPAPNQRQITLVLEGTSPTQRNVTGTIQYLNTGNSSVLDQSSITTNTSGQVTVAIPFGLPGTVNVRTLVAGYLSRNITGFDTTSTAVLAYTTPSLLAGDFNADQIINSLDFSLMNTNWLSSNSLTDVNKDGAVNSLDFAYVSNNWLQVGQ